MKYITIASKTISVSLVASLTAVIITLFILSFLSKKGSAHKKVADMMFNYAILFIFIWKLSILLIHPVMSSHHLLSILYFTGGKLGFVLSLLIIFLMLVFKFQANKLFKDSLQPLYLIILISFFLYHIAMIVFLPYKLFDFIIVILSLILILLLTRTRYRRKTESLMLWYGPVIFFLTFILPTHETILTGIFSYEQWLLLITSIFFLYVSFKFKK